VFWPLILYVRAGACARAGKPAEGLSLIEEAIEIAGTTPSLSLLPELYSMKGHLLLLLGDAEGAEHCYRSAFEGAQESDAQMLQLRGAIGLCRSQRERGDAQTGIELLRALYANFTEGFTTPDLVEAGNLLDSPPRERTGTRRGRS
jgi:tetratricopeptide (TPR) repeat protein